jgi:predicted metal-dependent HD superfamily phosphohydrolase
MDQEAKSVTLHQTWRNLLALYGAASAVVDVEFQELVERYASPGRYYHTLEHIRDVLSWVDSLASLARDLPFVYFAAWFHDAVYDSKAGDNEEQSAAYAEKVLLRLRVPRDKIARVTLMILATKKHLAAADDEDTQILLDSDLAILGAPPTDYTRYALAIRQEYAWVPEPAYRVGRRRVLEGFLGRSRIYFTEPMFRARESEARRNLTTEIQSLV